MPKEATEAEEVATKRLDLKMNINKGLKLRIIVI